MDGDELPEVVYQQGDYMGFIVLRYKDGDIYGYDVNYRGAWVSKRWLLFDVRRQQ